MLKAFVIIRLVADGITLLSKIFQKGKVGKTLNDVKTVTDEINEKLPA